MNARHVSAANAPVINAQLKAAASPASDPKSKKQGAKARKLTFWDRRLLAAEQDQRRAYDAIKALGSGFNGYHDRREVMKVCADVVKDSPSGVKVSDVVYRLWDRMLIQLEPGTGRRILVRIVNHWETEETTAHNQQRDLDWCWKMASGVAGPGYSWTLEDLAEGTCRSPENLRPMVEALVKDGRLIPSEITAEDREQATPPHEDADFWREKLEEEQRGGEPRFMLNWERWEAKTKAA